MVGAVVGESDTLWVFGYDEQSLKIVVSGVGVEESMDETGFGEFSLYMIAQAD